MTNMKKKRKDDNKIQRRINFVVMISLLVICSLSYYHKQRMLEVSNTTICTVIKQHRRAGRGFAKSEETIVEYFVLGKRYESIELNSSDSYNIGDCYFIEYSIENPQISKVLWNKGKQKCDCVK